MLMIERVDNGFVVEWSNSSNSGKKVYASEHEMISFVKHHFDDYGDWQWYYQ